LLEGCTKRVRSHGRYSIIVAVGNALFTIRKEYFILQPGEEVFIQGFLEETPQSDCFAQDAQEGDSAARFRLRVIRLNPDTGMVESKFIRGGTDKMAKKINTLISQVQGASLSEILRLERHYKPLSVLEGVRIGVERYTS